MNAQVTTQDRVERASRAAAVFVQEALAGNEWPQFGGAPTVVVRFSDGVYVMGASVEDVVSWYQCHFIAQPGDLRMCNPADLLPGGGGLTLGAMAVTLPDRLQGGLGKQVPLPDWETACSVPLVPFVLCTDRTAPACFVVADPTQPTATSTAWAMVMDDPAREAYVWETVNAWLNNGARPMRIPVVQVANLIQDLSKVPYTARIPESLDLTDILIRATLSRHLASVHAPVPQVDIDVDGTPIPTIVTFRERDMLDRTVEWMAGQGWLNQVGAIEITGRPAPGAAYAPSVANHLSGASAPDKVCAEFQARAQAPAAGDNASTLVDLSQARQLLAEASAMVASLMEGSKSISVADYRLLTRLREASSEAIKVWRMTDGTCVAGTSPLEVQGYFANFLGLAQPCNDMRAVSLHAQIQKPGQPVDSKSKTFAQAINEHIAKGGTFPFIVN